jgi:hypothetical protein
VKKIKAKTAITSSSCIKLQDLKGEKKENSGNNIDKTKSKYVTPYHFK